MPIQLQTSFAPKKPPLVIGGGSSFSGRQRYGSIFFVIAMIVFLLTAGLAGGVYVYKGQLVKRVKEVDVELAAARKSFEPEFIEEAARLHARIEAAQGLLAKHTTISPLFLMLEEKTLQTVRFSNFSVAREGTEVSLTLQGEAKSFNAVALQSDVFGGEKMFTNPIFSNFNLNDEGDVAFNFKSTLNTRMLSYRAVLLGEEVTEEETREVRQDEIPMPGEEVPL